MWENVSRAEGCVNTPRPLAHLIDSTDRQDAMNATHACSVVGCDRPHKARGWCGLHYSRAATGLPLEAPVRGYGKARCDVDGCDRPHRSNGYCKLHLNRFQRHGDPLFVATRDQRSIAPKGPASVQWKGGSVGYRAAHERVVRDRGAASNQTCVGCGSPASHWSYNNACPDELVSPSGLRYSPNPNSYSPRCTPCHSRFDRAERTFRRPS